MSAVRSKPYQQQCRVHLAMGHGEECEAHWSSHFTLVCKKCHFTDHEITDWEIVWSG